MVITALAQSLIDNTAGSLTPEEKQSLMQQAQATAAVTEKEVMEKTKNAAVDKGMDIMRANIQNCVINLHFLNNNKH